MLEQPCEVSTLVSTFRAVTCRADHVTKSASQAPQEGATARPHCYTYSLPLHHLATTTWLLLHLLNLLILGAPNLTTNEPEHGNELLGERHSVLTGELEDCGEERSVGFMPMNDCTHDTTHSPGDPAAQPDPSSCWPRGRECGPRTLSRHR